jgi:hypothetical protein
MASGMGESDAYEAGFNEAFGQSKNSDGDQIGGFYEDDSPLIMPSTMTKDEFDFNYKSLDGDSKDINNHISSHSASFVSDGSIKFDKEAYPVFINGDKMTEGVVQDFIDEGYVQTVGDGFYALQDDDGRYVQNANGERYIFAIESNPFNIKPTDAELMKNIKEEIPEPTKVNEEEISFLGFKF